MGKCAGYDCAVRAYAFGQGRTLGSGIIGAGRNRLQESERATYDGYIGAESYAPLPTP